MNALNTPPPPLTFSGGETPSGFGHSRGVRKKNPQKKHPPFPHHTPPLLAPVPFLYYLNALPPPLSVLVESKKQAKGVVRWPHTPPSVLVHSGCLRNRGESQSPREKQTYVLIGGPGHPPPGFSGKGFLEPSPQWEGGRGWGGGDSEGVPGLRGAIPGESPQEEGPRPPRTTPLPPLPPGVPSPNARRPS